MIGDAARLGATGGKLPRGEPACSQGSKQKAHLSPSPPSSPHPLPLLKPLKNVTFVTKSATLSQDVEKKLNEKKTRAGARVHEGKQRDTRVDSHLQKERKSLLLLICFAAAAGLKGKEGGRLFENTTLLFPLQPTTRRRNENCAASSSK
jgi:hypothetical protein